MIRTTAIGAPFAMARIGSVAPTLSATLSEPAATCCVTAEPLRAKLSFTSRPSAVKKPLCMAT